MLDTGNLVYVLMDETGLRVQPGTVVRREYTGSAKTDKYWMVQLNCNGMITRVHINDLLVKAVRVV